MATPRRLLAAAIIGIFGEGCFVGDAANGLPCDQDADCGVGISCVEDPALAVKCCGGSCSLGSSSGSTATTTTASSSTMGPTSLSATEPSSGPAVCGDGVVDAGEACDPQDPRSLPCTDDCQLLCGNGQLDAGEDCDDDEAGCGDDCLFSGPCGNAVLDAGEACDTRLVPEGTCLDDCRAWVALDWDGNAANSDFCVEESAVDGPWECTRWTESDVPGPRGSGGYFLENDPWDALEAGPWPEAVLRTRAIDFPDVGPEDSVEIEFVHELDFNVNPDEAEYVDYAELSIEAASKAAPRRFVPLGGIEPLSVPIACGGQSIDDACSSVTSEDYCESPLMRTAGRTTEEESVIAAYGPGVEQLDGLHRLRFQVRYDCSNWDDPENPPSADAWVLRRLKVTVRKADAGG